MTSFNYVFYPGATSPRDNRAGGGGGGGGGERDIFEELHS